VHTGKQITLPDELVNYDVYVILFQDGKVSAPVKINTKKGGIDVDNEWGGKVPEWMVAVIEGTFQMGSPKDEAGRDGDETSHSVTVGSFYMGKYEVSQAEYSRYTTNPSTFKGDTLPVEKVSWYEAVGYCNWLSGEEGLTPAYTINGTTVTWNKSADGYRLPTEAEWEYACRAGTNTAYNTGITITQSQANYNSSSTMAVDSFVPNYWGLYNMHGNVWEWCWDWYNNSIEAGPDPDGPDTGTYRIIRGGSWLNQERRFMRSANRDFYLPAYGDYHLGFRLVRGPVGR
jgi:formylglycine-generating enzyme required for sulfatase activity